MKRVIKASAGSAELKLQYIAVNDNYGEIGVRPVTIKGESVLDALIKMLDKLDIRDLDFDLDDVDEGEKPEDALISELEYANTGVDSDYILYLANAKTGEVYIDNNFPEVTWA